MKPPSSVALMAEDFDLPALGLGVVRYISYRSRANRAASSPPVPARISMITRERLASSPPMVRSSSSFHSASRSSRSSGSSASASSRISASSPSIICWASAIWRVELLEAAILLGQLAQRAVLAGDGRDARGIGQHLGIDEVAFELLEAGQFLVE